MPRRAMQFFILCVLVSPYGLFPFSLPADAQTDKTLTAQVGTPYSAEVQANGGLAPLTWKVSSGSLPPGLHLLPDGEIQGTPTKAERGPFTFTVSVSDSSQPPLTASMSYSFVIKPAPLRIIGVVSRPATLKIVGVVASPPSSAKTLPPARPAAAAAEPGQPAAKHAATPADSPAKDPAPAPAVKKTATVQPAKSPCAAAKTLPTLLGTPVNGQTTLAGCAEKGISSVQISVIDPGAPVQCNSQNPAQFALRPAPIPTNASSNATFVTFNAELSTPLKTGEQVCLAEIGANNQPVFMRGSLVVVAAPSAPTGSCATATSPSIPTSLVQGLTVVSGCAGTTDKSKAIVVGVDSPSSGTGKATTPSSGTENGGYACDAKGPENSSLVKPGVIDSGGVFHAELGRALKSGDSVCVWQYTGNTLTGYTRNKTPVAHWTYNQPSVSRGRILSYLSAGIILTQGNQFTSPNMYIGFDTDSNWIRSSHVLVNSEFGVKLTSIPTSAIDTSNAGATVKNFIGSEKAAVVSGDLYLPFYGGPFRWWNNGADSLFFAPIVTGGIQTITSGALNVTPLTPGTTAQTIDAQSLYPYWGAGLRLGAMKLPGSWNLAPRLLSHLDITIGQWQNFRQCLVSTNCTTTTGQATAGTYLPWLLSLDGRVDIPRTPVEIGLKSVMPLAANGQGSLQFFFGMRFDVACLYRTYAVQKAQSMSYSTCVDGGSASPAAANAQE